MTKIVVDSNILFSAILNINSKIAQLLINGKSHYTFYAPKYIRTEIWEHQEKIKKIARLSDETFIEIYELLLKNVIVLNHSIVSSKFYEKAEIICKDIDEDDTIFVAFSMFLEGKLWTGDKKLIKGLHKKEFKNTITTEDLYHHFVNERKT